jgi:hypothetical protein
VRVCGARARACVCVCVGCGGCPWRAGVAEMRTHRVPHVRRRGWRRGGRAPRGTRVCTRRTPPDLTRLRLHVGATARALRLPRPL